jgi:hypothetical protein
MPPPIGVALDAPKKHDVASAMLETARAAIVWCGVVDGAVADTNDTLLNLQKAPYGPAWHL